MTPIPSTPDIDIHSATCEIHQVRETYTHGVSFKSCGECWHVWQTEDEFRADLAEWHGEEAAHLDLRKVYACPLCTHDF